MCVVFVAAAAAWLIRAVVLIVFFFNDAATTEIYTLSLHDALPIYRGVVEHSVYVSDDARGRGVGAALRSEEHTSELQSRRDLVCRLLLEKKNKLSKQPHEASSSSATRALCVPIRLANQDTYLSTNA